MRNVRRGHPAPPELVAEVRRRYELIGPSPLLETSRAQAAALEARLGIPCRAAGRLWGPYPAEILDELRAAGATRLLSLPLAPQSVHVYHAAVEAALGASAGSSLVRAPHWGSEPALIAAFTATIDAALGGLGADQAPAATIVLTAHSLPARVIAAGDPYEVEFRRSAELVAAAFRDRGHRVEIAFQSQGATADVWIGPDYTDVLRALATQGATAVVVSPIGFLAEHVETLYDLDVEGAAVAAGLGLRYARARAVGTRAELVDALEAVARRALG